jgi:hypothetical protein
MKLAARCIARVVFGLWRVAPAFHRAKPSGWFWTMNPVRLMPRPCRAELSIVRAIRSIDCAVLSIVRAVLSIARAISSIDCTKLSSVRAKLSRDYSMLSRQFSLLSFEFAILSSQFSMSRAEFALFSARFSRPSARRAVPGEKCLKKSVCTNSHFRSERGQSCPPDAQFVHFGGQECPRSKPK